MVETDTSAVGLAVQMAQLHQGGVSAEEIRTSLQNLCQAQGMDEPAARARMQEASHIWSAMSTVLQRPGSSTTSTTQATKDSVSIGGEADDLPPLVSKPLNANKQLPAWLATLLAALQPTNTAQAAPRCHQQPDPDMFDGTRKQYQVFYQQLCAKVENDKEDFGSDKKACDYAFARLRGTAATLTLPYMNQMRVSGSWDFDELLSFFDQMFGDPHKEERAHDKLWSMSQSKKNICSYVMDFQEQLLLSNSNLDEDTKMMIFRKGLSHKLQDKLIGLKSRNLNELQNRTIEIADQLYRMDFYTQESSYSNYLQTADSLRQARPGLATPLYQGSQPGCQQRC
jgi:hypothetical protein